MAEQNHTYPDSSVSWTLSRNTAIVLDCSTAGKFTYADWFSPKVKLGAIDSPVDVVEAFTQTVFNIWGN